MDHSTQQQIAARLRQGDADAWAALYDAYCREVWRYVARRLPGGPSNPADTGDVVQEVFLAAARGARQFDASRGTLIAWLMGIARRQVAARYRGREHSEARNPGGCDGRAIERLESYLEGSEPSPVEVLAAAETAQLVRDALAGLPLEQELVLTWRYLDNKPVERMAAELGCSAGAVRSRLSRARTALRERLRSGAAGVRSQAPSPDGSDP